MPSNAQSPGSSQSSSQPLIENQNVQTTSQAQGDNNSTSKDGTLQASQGANDGNAILEWFDKLFEKINVIAGLGAGFMFTVIVDPPDESKLGNNVRSIEDVKTLVAVSWLCFVLAITFSSACSSTFDFRKKDITDGYDNGKTPTHLILFVVSGIVQGLVLAGFLTASLVVVAFNKKVGCAAVVLTATFALLLFGLLFIRLGRFFIYGHPNTAAPKSP